jgi:uncharacterized damage-inducible protein DinB
MSDTRGGNQQVASAYIAEARQRLSACHERIRHCVNQLDNVQLWWRPDESMNSIANLLLHLCGNLRQWLVAGVGGAADVRDRPREFAERSPLPKEELLRRLAAVVEEADTALAGVTETRLLERRRIQGFEGTVLSAIFDALTHLSGHAQEIIYITRLQLRDTYVFAWKPTTPEQGAVAPGGTGSESLTAKDALFEEMPAHPLQLNKSTEAMLLPTSEIEIPKAEDEAISEKPLLQTDYLLALEQEFQDEQDEGKL